jgi:CRISPR-associated protein Csd1
MIFQSLIALYDRLSISGNVPPFGFSVEDIGFILTIDEKGNLVGQPEDVRTKVNSTTYNFRKSIVPYTNKVNVRAAAGAAKTANFMVDKADYIFGMSKTSKKTVHQHSFKNRIEKVCQESKDAGVLAVKSFLNKWNPEDSTKFEDWKEMCGTHGKWIAFKLKNDSQLIHERPAIKKLWSDFIVEQPFPKGISFVDGEEHNIQNQYAQFKFGSGASLVSFNEASYESYGKSRGANAPISVDAEFRSSTALKFLFSSERQRIRIGDATVVFWAEKKSAMEAIFGQILNPFLEDQQSTVKVRKFLKAVQLGTLPNELKNEEEIKFYILGLSLNKARLSLRFWFVCTIEQLAKRFKAHFDNLKMEHSSNNDNPYPGIWHLLKETSRETKNISPVLGGSLTRAILTGTNYPQNLYHSVLGRLRADHNINYLKASILKAVLTRNYNMEVPMTLKKERTEVAYLLGRLFAALEKAQLDALGKNIKATIKDRFFSSASATPASVFPKLIRLSQHHIEKAEYGYKTDQIIAEIIDGINSFPAHLSLQEQGLFAIAYYQQKNAIDREIREAVQLKKNNSSKGDEHV